VEIASLEPRRTDCQSLCTLAHFTPPAGGGGFDYCAENPCGAIASVRAPRANWCPGSLTPPQVWDDLPAFSEPGAHSISVDVVGIAAGGSWLLSATYYGYGAAPP
jgi:hypothetical protein